MASTLCDNCQLRPKYFDGVATHPYCSKTCANKMKANNPRRGSIPGNLMSSLCEKCKIRPKYRDSAGFLHPYCGKNCANTMAPAGPPSNATPPAPSTGGTTIGTTVNNVAGNSTTGTNHSTKKGNCKVPGCPNSAFTNPDGSLSHYCCQAHKKLGETVCLMCRKIAKLSASHFCSTACTTSAEQQAPMILEVPKGHVTFRSISEQFKTSWRHASKPCPPVRRVYKIISSPALVTSYNTYRSSVESRGQFVVNGRTAGNENRRWHGTRRECNIGDKGHNSLCSSNSCPMCSIIRHSFDLSRWGSKTGWGRFGKGIYTSSTSSKSDDYASNDCTSKFKAVLLNKVVVGKGHKMIHDNTTLTAPPLGFDSVLAEKGGSLNYDELVVYKNEAIRPSFLVLYDDL